MQLISLQIHNFRGIREFATPIELHDYTLLVGPNNAGKSTVIDAIRVFYEKDRYRFTPERDMPKGVTGEESWIELGFKLSPEEYASLKSEYQIEPNRLVVRKYFAAHESSRTGKIFAYTKGATGELTLAKEPFYGASNVQNGKFGQLIYIPALSKVDEATKMTGPSALRDLVTDIVGDSISNTTAYRSLAESINEFSQDILQSQNPTGQSIHQLQQEIDSELSAWNIKTSFSIEPPAPTDIFKNLFQLSVQDNAHGGDLAVEQFGSGFQRQFIYTLIKMRAKYQQPAAKSSTKDFQPQMTLLLFEEPEAFLHPQQQELLARELRVLASNHTFQVICSTHSPTFVSRNSDKLTSIVRLRRDMGKVHKSQISQDQFSVITKGNIQKYTEIDEKFPQRDKFAKDHDDLNPQMEEIKYFMWLNPDRCSMFFARKVLIVEGYTEYALINRLIADGFIQDGIGVYILECNGKFKMHAYMSILTALEIEHAVIFDDDQNPANPVNSQRQNEINTLIKSVASDYTVKLQPISPDLETMLQIDMSAIKSDKQAHRKPQHTLYWYTQKRIDDELLKRFCAIVNDCIAVTKS